MGSRAGSQKAAQTRIGDQTTIIRKQIRQQDSSGCGVNGRTQANAERFAGSIYRNTSQGTHSKI